MECQLQADGNKTHSPHFWWPAALYHHLQSAGITEDVMRTECGSCSSHLCAGDSDTNDIAVCCNLLPPSNLLHLSQAISDSVCALSLLVSFKRLCLTYSGSDATCCLSEECLIVCTCSAGYTWKPGRFLLCRLKALGWGHSQKKGPRTRW
jgi:hypothetical protein